MKCNSIDAVDLVDSLEKVVVLTLAQPFSLGESYSLSVTGLRDTTGNAISSHDQVLQYTSDVQSVSILTSNIIEVAFRSDLDSANASAIDRYWLEEADQPAKAEWFADNPAKIRLHFAESLNDNTELQLYLFELLDADSSLLSTPANSFVYDTEPPAVEQINVPTDSTVLLTFNEDIESGSAVNPTYFTIDDGQVNESVLLASDQIKLVPANKLMEESPVILTYEELRDLNGNKMTRKRSVEVVYDQSAPRIDSVYQPTLNQLTIVASETIKEGSVQLDQLWYEVDDVLVYPNEFSLEENSLTIAFSASIPQVTMLAVGVTGWSDIENNELADTLYAELPTAVPLLTSIRPSSTTSIRVTFNHQMSGSNLEVENYQLDGEQAISVTKETGYYTITFGESMVSGNFYELTLLNLENVSSQPLAQQVYSFTFEHFVHSIKIIDSLRIVVAFDHTLDLDNSLAFNINGLNPNLQNINLEEPTQVILIPQGALEPNSYHHINWSAMTADRQLIPSFLDSAILDRLPPVIEEVESDFFGQLTITFSESLSESSLENLYSYSIIGKGSPTSAAIVSSDQVELVFDDLIIGEDYDLIYYNASDLSGNLTQEDTISFTYQPPALPVPGEIVINELMPDPVPSVGLPEREYIELWNRGVTAFNLKGLQISDRAKTINLPYYELAAGERVALASSSEGGLFLAVEGLPSLDNTSDSITISTILGTVLDIVEYDLSWYRNTDKQGGGYSLELINPDAACAGAANWRASEDMSGGTPGIQNSVYSTEPDGEVPLITDFLISSQTEIEIHFNEWMDTSMVDIDQLSFPKAISQIHFSDLQHGIIELGDALELGLLYEFTVGGFIDCSGNVISDTTIITGLPVTPSIGELIISEIMPDPSPTVGLPESEYVELWNRSDKLLDLSQLTLNGASLNGTIDSSGYLVLVPSGAADQFPGINILPVSNWSSLSNNSDSLLLESPDSILDQIVYDRNWYRDAEKSGGGYSLELINPDAACAGAANWRASEDMSGGTPGSQNSIYSTEPDGKAPLITDFSISSQTEIEIHFSEWMDTSMVDIDQLFFPKEILQIHFSDLQHGTIQLTEALVPGMLYEFTIGGFFDCSVNIMEDTTIITGLPATPSIGELIISEIMPDPSPTVELPESEYVELWNRSDKLLDLSQLTLNGASLSGAIDSSGYLVLVPSSSADQFPGINVLPVSNWPSLSNNSDSLLLESPDSNLDLIVYDRNWYRDAEKSDGGYSLELINPDAACAGAANWRASEDMSGGTPGSQNSIYSTEPDGDAPLITDFSISSQTEIEIHFHEWMDTSMVDIDQLFFPKEISKIHFSDLQHCRIVLLEALDPGVFDEFIVGGFHDCSGNLLVDTVLFSGWPISPEIGDLVITEIMADPSPVVGLPEEEYLELLNLTDSLLTLNSLMLNGTELSGIVPPNSYVILVPDNSTGRSLGTNTIPISPWESLSNSGETLILENQDTILVALTYANDWHDEAKKDGGFSIESIDPYLYCAGRSNWRSSQSETGGTPGLQNSVWQIIGDKSGPQLIEAFVEDSLSLKVRFDEMVLLPGGNWSLEALEIRQLDHNPIDPSEIVVHLSDEIPYNTPFVLEVSQIQDCYFNVSGNQEAELLRPEKSIEELFINEILFDPLSGGEDFVELYNASDDRYIDLSYLKWYSGATIRSISEEVLTLPPGGYVALTENRDQLIFDYPQSKDGWTIELEEVPSLSNNAGYLVIIDQTGKTLDSIYYEDGYHSSLLGDVEGVSLERLSIDYPAIDKENWSSASSVAGFATPGFKNSQKLGETSQNDQVDITPRVFVPGSSNPSRPSFTTINYTLPTGGQFANVHIYDVNGRVIKTIGQGISLSADGFLTWDGSTDQGGVARMGNYIVVFELYGGNLDRQFIRKTVTIGAEF
jgi:hypothetical protein